MAGDKRIGSTKWELSCGGQIPLSDIIMFVIDKDINQPDQAVAVLRNDEHKYTGQCKVDTEFELKASEPGSENMQTLFKGKVCGVEPQYKGGGESRITVRAFCSLHQKLQGKKSKTFQDKTDKDIITEVLGQVDFKGPEINHKHVTQDNQSDLDFARLRAARIGCHIWSENGSIKCKEPPLGEGEIAEFKIFDNQSAQAQMKSFSPRQTGAQVLESLEVRGWNPETKKEIVQRVKAKPSPLGGTEASAASKGKAAQVTFNCDSPIWSDEEAKAMAEAKILEANLGFITAEAECMGNPTYLPSKVVKIDVNTKGGDRFDGKYYVMGATHKYVHGTQTNPDGGYTTILRLARNAEGG
jgi:phage protein D